MFEDTHMNLQSDKIAERSRIQTEGATLAYSILLYF